MINKQNSYKISTEEYIEKALQDAQMKAEVL